VYRFPRSIPPSGSASGSAFSAISEPPGRSGASHSSHETQSTINAMSVAEAVLRSRPVSR
jgi:hypothetical protein